MSIAVVISLMIAAHCPVLARRALPSADPSSAAIACLQPSQGTASTYSAPNARAAPLSFTPLAPRRDGICQGFTLFCALLQESENHLVSFNRFRTLCAKHPGWHQERFSISHSCSTLFYPACPELRRDPRGVRSFASERKPSPFLSITCALVVCLPGVSPRALFNLPTCEPSNFQTP